MPCTSSSVNQWSVGQDKTRKLQQVLVVTSALLLGLVTQASTLAEGDSAPSASVPSCQLTVQDTHGTALGGAMVTYALDQARRVTRFTPSSGSIILDKQACLPHTTIAVRYPGYAATSLTSDASGAPSVARLSAHPNPLVQVTSDQWLSLLPEGDDKREFIVNCGTCHEISHDRVMLNGQPRSADDWLAAITAMRAMDVYEVIPPDFDDKRIAQWLAAHLTNDRISALAPSKPTDPDTLAALEITEYELPTAMSLPHDLVIGPDQHIWITAFLNDALWVLDPETGHIKTLEVDSRPTINAQPRALEFDPAGTLWLVNGGTESVLRVNPNTGDYTEIPVGMYAHSIDIGPDGRVWVNDYFSASERLAVIDPSDLSVTIVPVPPANRPHSEGLPLPYGLQVDSVGRVYSTQLAANTLVSHHSQTGDNALFIMPQANSGPRRPGLDNKDGLWIPEFNTGYVTHFDPLTSTFKRVSLGNSALGLYDVEVNQRTNDVWASAALASGLVRYEPAKQRTLHVPLPTEPAYTRHLAVDEATGDIWSAYSSLPPADPKAVRIRIRSTP